MSNETILLKKIQLKLSPKTILFRNNTGVGWVGKTKKATNGNGIYIEDPRPLHAGLCVGSSDLIGWQTVIITPEMVGRKVAVFVAIEGKTGRQKPTKEQLNFINQVNKSGGIAGCVWSEDQADVIVNS